MNQKVVAVLVIVLMFVAFLFLTPRGREFSGKYLLPHFSTLGNLLKGITSRASGGEVSEGEKLSIVLSSVPLTDMNGQQFSLKGQGFTGEINYEYVSFAGGTVSFPSTFLQVSIPNMVGDVSFASDRIQISGKTSQLGLNDLSFNTTSTDFLIIGVPLTFDLDDIQEDNIVFTDVSGSLSWAGLKGIPPLLVEDNLELHDFQGFITMSEGKITITGLVSKLVLNGVTIAT